MPSLKKVLVTGGNNGIGYETVKALLLSDKPYHVLLGTRSVDKGKAAIETLQKECSNVANTVELMHLDLNSDESIEKACEKVEVTHGHLDILINNAGATWDIEFLAGKATLRECFNKAYDVNVAGTNVLTWTLIPLLLKSTDPRLIFVSGLSAINQAAEKYFPTPPQPAGWPKKIDFETIGYRCSKTALNMLMLDWNHKLKEDGVKVWGVMPGLLSTGLGNLTEEAKAKFPGLGHASQGGEMLKSVVEGKFDADVGKLVGKDGPTPF